MKSNENTNMNNNENEYDNINKLLPFLIQNGLIGKFNQKKEEDYELCQKVLIDIAKNKTNDIQYEKILKGEENIIENMIIKYSKHDIKNEDIKNISSLSLKLPEKFNMLSDIGYYIPKLSNLDISYSIINNIEDIGISFKNLKVLNISNTSLKDLSGIYCFDNLVELDASHNIIEDIDDLGLCLKLVVLKLNDNMISNKASFTVLKSMQELKILYIANNPFIKYVKLFTFDNVKLDI